MVNESAFNNISDDHLVYCYSWKNTKELTTHQNNQKIDEIKEELVKSGTLTDLVQQSNNQAIMFTGNDMGSDKMMMICLLDIIMIILAFIFGITIKSTIEQEASVIGTLRASGFTRIEMVKHYLVLPLLVTFIAAVVGNVLGYTIMKDFIANMYYHSYSLPTFKTLWNGEAFILTTIVPLIIIFIVNIIILLRVLQITPLNFLRHNLRRHHHKKAIRIPNFKFMTRFRIRIILQNLTAYLTMFIGIFFASVLLLFGLMMSPLLSSYKSEVIDSKIANYQYVLKTPVTTNNKDVEKYAINSLNNESDEEIMIYGIQDNSLYLNDLKLFDDGVVISDGYQEKYNVDIGDKITLNDEYLEKDYQMIVKGVYHYPASLAVFMNNEYYNNLFDLDDNYFNGYFSNDKLDDIDESYIATIITQSDLTTIADQLDDSMGSMFYLIEGFAIIMYILIIYLLAKMILEKNTQSISMLKILGYDNQETSKLYNWATLIVVGISLLITLPIANITMEFVFHIFMQEIHGWLTYYIAPWIYPTMFVMGMLSYFIVHVIQMKKIKNITLSYALKSME